MEVKPGYKQTEIGVIPEDWDVCKLGKYVAFKTGPFGSTLHKSDYVDGGVPVINPMQIVNGKIQPTQSMAITEQAAQHLSDFRLSTGNIIIGRRGEMGRCALIGVAEHGWLCGTGSMVIRTTSLIDGGYLQRVLSSPPIIAAIESTSVGSTMINLNQGTLGNLVIALPPKTEQEAIAEALSDADALLEALAQLLAKKRHIKQGAMQELLTGKKRLPGFSGEWEVKRLKHIAPLQRGFDLPNRLLRTGRYPVVYSNGILNYHENYMVKGPGLITGRSGTLGVVHFTTEDFWPHNTTLWVTDFRGNDPKFIYYLYSHIRLDQFGTGSGVPTLNRNDVHESSISIPLSYDEQTAIVAILSDMDTEIAALEAQIAKARLVKQGMMQELLSGRIRLV